MRRAIERNDLTDTLKNAAVLTSELRTGALTPKVRGLLSVGNCAVHSSCAHPATERSAQTALPTRHHQVYYELYMDVFDSLGYLEVYFMRLSRGGMPIAELYHKVQSAGQAVVRLFLLVLAGSCYVRSGQAPAKVVLRDLLSCVKAVQHPQRGLFLRYYLSCTMKDKLPDEGSPYESASGGSLRDALGFLLANFGEMNRLWVRMQHGVGEWGGGGGGWGWVGGGGGG